MINTKITIATKIQIFPNSKRKFYKSEGLCSRERTAHKMLYNNHVKLG